MYLIYTNKTQTFRDFSKLNNPIVSERRNLELLRNRINQIRGDCSIPKEPLLIQVQRTMGINLKEFNGKPFLQHRAWRWDWCCEHCESAHVSVLLTFHPRCCDKTLRRGPICRRSPFCPVCCHKIASSQTPAGRECFRKAGYEGNGSVCVCVCGFRALGTTISV